MRVRDILPGQTRKTHVRFIRQSSSIVLSARKGPQLTQGDMFGQSPAEGLGPGWWPGGGGSPLFARSSRMIISNAIASYPLYVAGYQYLSCLIANKYLPVEDRFGSWCVETR